jgi:hypothetical protein
MLKLLNALVRFGTLSVLLLGVFVGIPGAAEASATGGSFQVLQPNGEPRTAGGSNTPFAVKLPYGAACPGDTAHEYYVINSYVVPRATNPGTVKFGGGFPQTGSPMIDTTGTPYLAQNTAINTGVIPLLPLFSWTAYAQHGGWQPGDYNVGVACADRWGNAARYWNAKFRFVASQTDPGKFTWTLLDAPRSTSSTGASSLRTIVGVLVGLAVIGGVAAVVVGRRRRVAGVRPGDRT